MPRPFPIFPSATFAILIFASLFQAPVCLAIQQERIEFNRDIRPILSDRCFQCHGPDEKKREADLRLDLEDSAKIDLGGYHAIVPRKPEKSILIQRIRSKDDSERMPPADSGKSLSKAEKDLLERWIAQGAVFEPHWSFQKVTQPRIPVNDSSWPRNEIDQFILRKLKENGLRPSPPADPSTLIRRLHLDLTGLIPDPVVVRNYLKNPSWEAYEKVVDNLLDSPHFGERMGRHWLDLARFADSNGYANDGLRSIWPYRDWVIRSLNEDMPFDQFSIEQLAGDLLENPTEFQKIATGFHRNTPFQTEGGSDPEQYRVERTKNRTDTTGAVWMGMTVGCAQCHTHKFDPITHQEYYQLYAFFNDIDEPNLSLTSTPLGVGRADEKEIARVRSELQKLDERIKILKKNPHQTTPYQPAWKSIVFQSVKSRGGAVLTRQTDNSYLASGINPPRDTYLLEGRTTGPVRSLRIETITHDSLPRKGPGRAGNGNFVLAELKITAGGKPVKITSAFADHEQKGYPVIDSYDGDAKTGWAINVSSGSLNVNRAATFVFDKEFSGPFEIQMATYEQGSGYNIGRFRISSSPIKPPISDQRKLQLVTQQQKKLTNELNRLLKATPMTLAISERNKPRQSFIQKRGDFLDPGPVVQPNTFAVLPPLTSSGNRANRLDLAQWLVSDSNPLTPRVQVNRMWQHLFGVGLVETENDFGYQGSLPSHPDLLDFLAHDLMSNDWKLKRLYKKILMSATYRQASVARDDAFLLDPKNRLLARQNRYRVEGEIVRDLGLSASGLLSRKMGGPSVFPPIPPNVIGTSSANHRWPTSKGEDRYRRGIYTAVYRANVYPQLLSFDGPDRDNPCTRRSRSNTPLQALTLANDAAFLEMWQAFGKRIMSPKTGTAFKRPEKPDEKIEFAFWAAMSRKPSSSESQRLKQYFESSGRFYQQHPEMAKAISGQEDANQASWVAVARLIMNLDEFITRE